MAAKVIFLLAVLAVAFAAENDCNCDPPSETEDKALWDFLKKLSDDFADADDEEMRAVLPGVLSPLLECNCLEKNRRKRRIMPEVETVVEKQTTSSEESLEETESVREKKSIHYNTKRCPHGMVWIGIMCVPEEYLE